MPRRFLDEHLSILEALKNGDADLVEERMQRGADDTMFLYEDRAYSAGEVNQRIANCQIRSMPASLSLRQGTAAKFSPP